MAKPEEVVVGVDDLEAYVVIDRLVEGLAGGGLRFHPSASREELRRLARTMTLKWATLGLPFGGCKLAIRGDPATERKEEVLRRFAQEVGPFVRDRVFTGPDMGTTPADLRPFFATVGQDAYDVVAGRLRAQGHRPTPKEDYRRIMGELQDRITGRALARATRKAWGRVGGSLQGVPVAVQGYGSVGRVVTEEMSRYGARIVAVADARGTVYRRQGLDPRLLLGPEPGIVNRDRLPEGTEALPAEAWLEAEAEILVPASVADAIDGRNVDQVQGRLLSEGANIPVPEDVERELHSRGVLVLPDFLVNGGLAGAFGALLTRTWQHAGDVETEVVWRIVSTTLRVLNLAMREDRPPREVAQEMAGLAGSPTRGSP